MSLSPPPRRESKQLSIVEKDFTEEEPTTEGSTKQEEESSATEVEDVVDDPAKGKEGIESGMFSPGDGEDGGKPFSLSRHGSVISLGIVYHVELLFSFVRLLCVSFY